MEKVDAISICCRQLKISNDDREKTQVTNISDYWNSYSEFCSVGEVKVRMRNCLSQPTQTRNIYEKVSASHSKQCGRNEKCEEASETTQSDGHKTPTAVAPQRKFSTNVRLKLKSDSTKWHQVFLLIILTTLTLFCQLSEECPATCECKWKSGKESVICANAKNKLIAIPLGLDPSTQLLDLSKNNIQLLQSKVFHSLNLLNLQKIFLSECNLKKLEKDSFYKLNNLVELDLSRNKIDSIPSHTFDQIPELRELKLSSNPITRIVPNAFFGLSRLVRLELSRCRIGSVDPVAFRGLVSLEWLKLDNNRLSVVTVFSFYPLKNLHGLELFGNSWNCSCALQPLRDWMFKSNVPYNIPPVCSEPTRLAGKAWDKLQREDFACVPKVQTSALAATGELTKAIEGENATLVCRLQATADTKVRWLNVNVNKPVVVTSSRYSLSESFVQGGLDGEKVTSQPATSSFSGGKQALGTKTSKLTVIKTRLRDAGMYSCRAESRAGSVSANFTLQILQENAEEFSGRYLLYGATVATLLTLSTCLLLLCIVFYCGKEKATVTQEKVELSHINGGRLLQNGHTQHNLQNGGTTSIPLLHNRTNSSTYDISPNHCPGKKNARTNLLRNLMMKSPGNNISLAGNNNSTTGLVNKKYKALPTSDPAANDKDVHQPHESSGEEDNEFDDDDDDAGKRDSSTMNKESSCKVLFVNVPETPQHSKLSFSNNKTEKQKFPDLINDEGSLPSDAAGKLENQTTPESQFIARGASYMMRPKVLIPTSSHHLTPSSPAVGQHKEEESTRFPNSSPSNSSRPLINTHRRSSSESESQGHLFPPPPRPNQPRTFRSNKLDPPNGSIPTNSTNSSIQSMSESSTTYGSTSTYQTMLSQTPPTATKFTFNQRPTPNPRQSSNPNHIYYYRHPLQQQHSSTAGFHYQRRSMPTSPVHYPSSDQYYPNSTYMKKQSPGKLQGQGSDPGLTHPEEYDFHAAKLAAFLEEYRQLQLELMRMNQSLMDGDDPSSNINVADHNSSSQKFKPNSHNNVNSAESFLQQQQHLKSILKNSAGTNNNYLV